MLSSIIHAPRQIKNLIIYPGLGICIFLTLVVGRFSAYYLTTIYVALFLEGLLSIARYSCNPKHSDFRSEWSSYKSKIFYLLATCLSYILSSVLDKGIGWYSLFLFAASFAVCRLYLFEVTELVDQKNDKSRITIGSANKTKNSNDVIPVFDVRAANVKLLNEIIDSVLLPPETLRLIRQKSQFSGWQSSSIASQQLLNLQQDLNDTSTEAEKIDKLTKFILSRH